METDSRFRYTKSAQLAGVTVLQATMTSFSYDRHAHEEHAFGVTLTGRQHFFSRGEHHRSTPGTVIHFIRARCTTDIPAAARRSIT